MSLPNEVRDAVQYCFDTWDLTVAGGITVKSTTSESYMVSVPFSGTLLYTDLTDGHANLLYNKEVEILFYGVEDGNLLLEINE